MCIGHVMSLISFLSHIYFDRDCALHIRLQVQDKCSLDISNLQFSTTRKTEN